MSLEATSRGEVERSGLDASPSQVTHPVTHLRDTLDSTNHIFGLQTEHRENTQAEQI